MDHIGKSLVIKQISVGSGISFGGGSRIRFVHNAPDHCSPMHYSPSPTKSPDSSLSVWVGRGESAQQGEEPDEKANICREWGKFGGGSRIRFVHNTPGCYSPMHYSQSPTMSPGLSLCERGKGEDGQ